MHVLGLDPEADTGSREENASKQQSGPRFRFHQERSSRRRTDDSPWICRVPVPYGGVPL